MFSRTPGDIALFKTNSMIYNIDYKSSKMALSALLHSSDEKLSSTKNIKRFIRTINGGGGGIIQ